MSDVKLVVEAVLEDGGSGLTQAIEENAKRASAAAERETKRAAEKERRENEKTEREARREKEKTQREARREQEKTAREQRRLYEENAEYELEVARDVGRARAEIEQRLDRLRQQKQQSEANDQIRRTRERERDAERLRRNAERLDRETSRSADNRRRRDIDEKLRGVNEALRKEKSALAEVERERAKLTAAEDRRRKEAENRRYVKNQISARNVGSDAIRNVSRLGRGAASLAGDLARGAGIDFSLSAAFQQRFDANRAATTFANQGFGDGTKGFASRDALRDRLLSRANEIAATTGFDPKDVIAAAAGFNELTGKTHLAITSLELMAKTAMATGANMGDVGRLYGQIAMIGGEGTTQAALDKVALMFGGLGREGAIESRDFLTEAPKLAAQTHFAADPHLAFQFNGNDKFANLTELVAMGQIARGGVAGTKATAAQAAAGLVADLNFGRTRKSLNAHGIKTHTKDSNGIEVVRNPMDVILDVLSKSGGSSKQVANLLPNKIGQKVALSFLDDYTRAYTASGGSKKEKDEAGKDAVRRKYYGIADASMTSETRDADAAFAANSPEGRARVAQQKINQSLGDLADRLLPNLLEQMPTITGYLEKFGGVVEWASTHVGAAVSAGIAASFVQAGASEVVKRGVAGIFESMGLRNGSIFAGAVFTGVTLFAQAVSVMQGVSAAEGQGLNKAGDIMLSARRALNIASLPDATPEERAKAKEAWDKLQQLIVAGKQAREAGAAGDAPKLKTAALGAIGVASQEDINRTGYASAYATIAADAENEWRELRNDYESAMAQYRMTPFNGQQPPNWVESEAPGEQLGKTAGNALYVHVVNSHDGSGGGNGRKGDK